ncbi:7634_t:CDS:2 [Funneliformis caledonium]|uniref:Inositol oxygenase n=1 Tax=Funneliformis caledonium TaxID=1117310 RepID=A0A9N8ZC41_9GLOM|nr:7634_t:CDS:2 [Funneliformis caledonium]
MHLYHPLSHHYILVKVFGYLTNQRDIYNCTLVNTQWNTSVSPFLYRAPKFTSRAKFSSSLTKYFQTIKSAKDEQTFQPYHEMLREWNLKYAKVACDIAVCCPNIEKLGCVDGGFLLGDNLNRKNLLKAWTRLKSITLYHNCGTDLILEAIRMNCSRLEELILCNCPVTDIGLIEVFKTIRGLKLLRFNHCNEISNQSLIMMSKYCNSLVRLDLINCNRLNDNGILALADSSHLATNLRSLYLEALNIDQNTLLILARNIMNLRELYLRTLVSFGDEVITAFNCLEQLTLHCPRINGWNINEAIRIRELSLFMTNIKLQELNAICKTCHHLEKFTLDVKQILAFSFSMNKQTVSSVIEKRTKFSPLNNAKLCAWEALELLNTLIDDSDPDTQLSQIEHCLQTAESLRKDGQPRWLILTGLIHDLGKLLFFYGAEGQWDVVGDTFPVGCRFSPSIIFPEFFKNNPDYTNPKYNTLYGIYEPNCGLDNVLMSYGHDEYMYQVVKNYLPAEASYIIRYHSFYAQHRENAYTHLMNETDHEMMKWVKIFNPFDLYSKSDQPPNIHELKPYYLELIREYFPEKICW